MKLKTNLLKNLPIILLILAIALSPSFSFGKIAGNRIIEIRVEDILLLILGLFWIINALIIGKTKIKKPPLFLPIVTWISIGLLSVLTNWILGNIGLSRGFFYLLKEIEFFFLYFYLFYHIRNFGSIQLIVKIWLSVGIINIFIILFQFLQGIQYGEYGPGLFREQGPFPSGGFFLILFAYFINILLYYYLKLKISSVKKILLSIAVLSIIIGIVSSGSKAAILATVLVVILSGFCYQIKLKKFRGIAIGLGLLLMIAAAIHIITPKVVYLSSLQKQDMLTSLNARKSIWQAQLEAFPQNPINLFLGLGKSAYLRAEESHNQYLRNFIETGVVGSLIFFFLIYSILKIAFKNFLYQRDPMIIALSCGLFTSTIAMLFASIPNDAFIVVKVNEVYWSLAAITVSSYSLKKYNHNQS